MLDVCFVVHRERPRQSPASTRGLPWRIACQKGSRRCQRAAHPGAICGGLAQGPVALPVLALTPCAPPNRGRHRVQVTMLPCACRQPPDASAARTPPTATLLFKGHERPPAQLPPAHAMVLRRMHVLQLHWTRCAACRMATGSSMTWLLWSLRMHAPSTLFRRPTVEL